MTQGGRVHRSQILGPAVGGKSWPALGSPRPL